MSSDTLSRAEQGAVIFAASVSTAIASDQIPGVPTWARVIAACAAFTFGYFGVRHVVYGSAGSSGGPTAPQ